MSRYWRRGRLCVWDLAQKSPEKGYNEDVTFIQEAEGNVAASVASSLQEVWQTILDVQNAIREAAKKKERKAKWEEAKMARAGRRIENALGKKRGGEARVRARKSVVKEIEADLAELDII